MMEGAINAGQLSMDGHAGLPFLGASPSRGPSGLPPVWEASVAMRAGDRAAGPMPVSATPFLPSCRCRLRLLSPSAAAAMLLPPLTAAANWLLPRSRRCSPSLAAGALSPARPCTEPEAGWLSVLGAGPVRFVRDRLDVN